MAQVADQSGCFDLEVRVLAGQQLCDCDHSWLHICSGAYADSLEHFRQRGSVAQQGENHCLCACTSQNLSM